MNRRAFIRTTAAASGWLVLPAMALKDVEKTSPGSVKAITQGPGYHWFGYYDKRQFDPTSRYALGMRVSFEHRSPTELDVIQIGMVDLEKGDAWKQLGESRAWGWQQGCMLQWIPGSSEEVIWNDREGDHFVSRVLNVRTGKMRTLPKAIYALSGDGKWAIGTEFSRIQDLRPGYGYPGIRDPYFEVKTPKEIGLYKMNLQTGEHRLLFSLADVAKIAHQGSSVEDNFHWFNHLLFNTDGTRFTFLHRWRAKREDRQVMASRNFVTRMFTADAEGKDLFMIDPSGFTSHFVWRDPRHICAWTKPAGHKEAFYLLEDKTGKFQIVGEEKMPVNGHNTYLPVGNQEWILNDNYATSHPDRQQIPYLYHIPTDRRIELGSFYEPEEYKGEWRCDLHPRYSPDGKKVIVDSTHGGNGRQMYLIDISAVIKQ